jgi:tetratricopeptide (TPR) repeat protein
MKTRKAPKTLTPILRVGFTAAFLLFSGLLGGCGFFNGSFESVSALDQSGQSARAVLAYQEYLRKHPATSLAPKIYYRIAANYQAQSDFTSAVVWYEKILSEYPHTDEELHALLDLAALYQDQLKDPAKAEEYSERAFNRYMDNRPIQDSVQPVINAQYLAAAVQFSLKNYKGTDDTLSTIAKTYPYAFIQPDLRGKIDALADRSRRAQDIAKAGVDWIVLKNEIPYDKSHDADFLPPAKDDQALPSPDGLYLAMRKRAADQNYYLYVGKNTPKNGQATLDLVSQTIGAESPAWSPDSQDLVYWQTSRKLRKLQKTNIQSRITQTLFYTKKNSLGIHPAYHPSGNKIAYIYEGRVCLVNTGDAGYKQLIKTKQMLDYTADLAWSIDGTMIRCTQTDKQGHLMDELLVLDLSVPIHP